MSLQTAHDIPLFVRSENASSERRITPSWSIAHLKMKLESVTGIPPSSQKLTLRLPSQGDIAIEAPDEESTQVGTWRLQAYAEIYVFDTRPACSRPPVLNPDSVPKYMMPTSTYETLPSTVLAWKKANKLGRFDPSATEMERKKVEEAWREVEARNIKLEARCRLLPESHRRGFVAYIGPVPEIPAAHAKKFPWIGIILDEPQGKNDGSVGETVYFKCESKRGVFVRADRVEVGDWGVAGIEDEDELGDGDMEEI